MQTLLQSFPAALLILTLLLAGPGCGSQAGSTESTAAAETKPPAWNWEFYPPMPRMRIAALPCQLLPKSSISIHSPVLGSLRVHVDSPQTNLPAGFVWAEFEPEIYSAEAESLEQARLKLEEREKIQMEIDLPRHILRLTREIEEAEGQMKVLQLFNANPELADKAFRYGTKGGAKLENALERAEIELGFLKETLRYLEEENLTIIGVDLPGQKADWERRKNEFERRLAQSRLKMPFDGQLTVNLPLTDGVQEYPVNSSQEVAVARDLSQIRLRVPLSNPAWVGLPAGQITAVLRLPTGEELHAPFAFQKIERVQFREESVYYFEVSPEQAPEAARLIGTEVSCELWVTLPRPARVVPKYSLVLNKPEAFQGRNWRHGVDAAWPGAQVLVEGQTALAIVLPNDPQNL